LPGDGSIRSRSVAILVADGVSRSSVAALQKALLAAGAKVHLVAQQIKEVVLAGADASLEAALMLERKANQLLFATRNFDSGHSVRFEADITSKSSHDALARCRSWTTR
jgi:hypothetical protein